MAQQVSVSLEEKHRRIVERHAKRIGITAFSTALQSIIIQFDQMQKATAPAAETPAPALAVPVENVGA